MGGTATVLTVGMLESSIGGKIHIVNHGQYLCGGQVSGFGRVETVEFCGKMGSIQVLPQNRFTLRRDGSGRSVVKALYTRVVVVEITMLWLARQVSGAGWQRVAIGDGLSIFQPPHIGATSASASQSLDLGFLRTFVCDDGSLRFGTSLSAIEVSIHPVVSSWSNSSPDQRVDAIVVR